MCRHYNSEYGAPIPPQLYGLHLMFKFDWYLSLSGNGLYLSGLSSINLVDGQFAPYTPMCLSEAMTDVAAWPNITSARPLVVRSVSVCPCVLSTNRSPYSSASIISSMVVFFPVTNAMMLLSDSISPPAPTYACRYLNCFRPWWCGSYNHVGVSLEHVCFPCRALTGFLNSPNLMVGT